MRPLTLAQRWSSHTPLRKLANFYWKMYEHVANHSFDHGFFGAHWCQGTATLAHHHERSSDFEPHMVATETTTKETHQHMCHVVCIAMNHSTLVNCIHLSWDFPTTSAAKSFKLLVDRSCTQHLHPTRW